MNWLIIIAAVATWYRPMDFGPVLYGGDPVPSGGVWAAMDVEQLRQRRVLLDDEVIVHFLDYPEIPPLLLAIRDAGPLGEYYIEDFPDLPLMLDIHYRAWPVALEGKLSARVLIINRSAAKRVLERMVEQ